jgi:hypothetical protein
MNQNIVILVVLSIISGFGYHQYYDEPLYGRWQQQIPLEMQIQSTIRVQRVQPDRILEIKQDQLNIKTGQAQQAYPYEKLGVNEGCTQIHADQQVRDYCVYGDQLVVRSLDPERIEHYERIS